MISQTSSQARLASEKAAPSARANEDESQSPVPHVSVFFSLVSQLNGHTQRPLPRWHKGQRNAAVREGWTIGPRVGFGKGWRELLFTLPQVGVRATNITPPRVAEQLVPFSFFCFPIFLYTELDFVTFCPRTVYVYFLHIPVIIPLLELL